MVQTLQIPPPGFTVGFGLLPEQAQRVPSDRADNGSLHAVTMSGFSVAQHSGGMQHPVRSMGPKGPALRHL